MNKETRVRRKDAEDDLEEFDRSHKSYFSDFYFIIP